MVFLTGRPLRGSAADMALFVGRGHELAQLERAVAAGLNTVVVGEHGVGATSLLHTLASQRRSDGDAASSVLVRCGGARSVVEVLTRVVSALPGVGLATPTVTGLLQQLAQAAHHSEVQGLVFVVDDLPAALGAELLAEHRDELWASGTPWVVSVPLDNAGVLLALPGGAFFEVRLDLADLELHDAVELVTLRVPDLDDAAAAQLVRAAGSGNPRRVLDVARAVISLGSGEVGPGYAAHTVALQGLGRPACMLFTELLAVGAASASDTALQERMGWSRVRVQQVLTQLEQAGLAHSSTSRPAGGQGRARKVFHPVAPEDWFDQQTGVPA